MTPRRLGAAALAAAAFAAAAGWSASARDDPPLTRATGDRAVVTAARDYTPLGGMDARVVLDARRVREWVRTDARQPPLPPGGNFNGVAWENLDGQLSLGDVDGMLQHNAYCQWQRAAHEHRSTATAERVLAQMATWPVLAAGGTPVLACYGNHDQEVRYAQSLGLTPST